MKNAEHNRELILHTLRMERDAYDQLLFDNGCKYLELYMLEAPGTVELIRSLPAYWQWWTTQADLRNAAYVAENELEERFAIADAWERSQLQGVFDELHAADMLRALRPARHVMREAVKVQREQVKK